MRIISRAEWGARAPRGITTTTWAKRIGVAVHYSQGNPANTPRDLQNYAMDTLGYVDTHYNFFVNRAGEIFEGRGWLVVAAHAENQNTPWIGVCFIGQAGDVTDAAKASIRWMYDEACRLSGRTLQYSGHGQLPGQNTSCPGDNLKAWIALGMPYPDGGDMADLTVNEKLHAIVALGGSAMGRKITWEEAQRFAGLSPSDKEWTDTPPTGYFGSGLVHKLDAIRADIEALMLGGVDLDVLAAKVAALVPEPPTAEQVAAAVLAKKGELAKAVLDEDHARTAD